MARITCRRCKSVGPFAAVRAINEIADIVDDDGEPIPGARWDFANETNACWINCGVCGNSWRTRRTIVAEDRT